MNKEIFQTKNFTVESVEKPHITRTDGGHIMIKPKVRLVDRTQLTPELAIELMRLTMIVGEAMTKGLNQRGIDIGRINYQDNGNWSVFKPEGPYMHVHLYGRAKSAKIQKYGDACNFPQRDTGFYDSFEPLNDDDIQTLIDKSKSYTNEVAFIGLTLVDESLRVNRKGESLINKRVEEFNNAIKEICEKNNLPFFDMFQELSKLDYIKLLYDGLHPNSEGHQKMYELIKDFLIEKKIID